jgi:hypothetical protein
VCIYTCTSIRSNVEMKRKLATAQRICVCMARDFSNMRDDSSGDGGECVRPPTP